ncbi:MAG: UDP-N-acetylmuramate--L-alanine ligase [Actinobacteria bacterium]|nr:UDP-N-acetylmuramate--L-alanine ligase [Actinomycetota bacterium]
MRGPDLDLAAGPGAVHTVHIVGVGGSGMSAIAVVLAGMGQRVSGSDLKESPVLDRLRLHGVDVHVGHDPRHVPASADALIVSTAIPDTNPEVVAARERGVAVLARAEALWAITATRRTVAVSGTHGKTTTSSLLALILREAGWQPSFIIGGDVNEVGGNAALDDGEWLVVEADESDGTFLRLHREVAVVTSVEPDHLEHWGGFEPLAEAFRQFLADTPGFALVWGDDPQVVALAPGAALTYGFSEGCDYQISSFEQGGEGCRFSLRGPEGELGRLAIPVPGRHNALNATAAAGTALALGVPFAAVAAAVGRFAGVARRFQFRGEIDGRSIVDDYAHLPSEIEAVVETARAGPWSRVVAVFQPHRFSRTATLWQDFAHAFDAADVVVLTDVYAAGEAPRPGVSGQLILQAVVDARPSGRVVYLPHRAEIAAQLPSLTRPGDVVLTLGAGDVTLVADEWRARAGGAGERG